MKIIFNRQNIINAVAPLMNTVGGKSTVQAAEGILIQTEGSDKCVLTTFDLEKGTRVTVDAQIEEDGSCIINAQKFNQTLRVMEGEEVTFTVNEKMNAEIYCGKSSHKMSALSSEDFPELPRLTGTQGFKISQKILSEMLGKVSFAMGVNDPRAVLNGCYVNIEKDGLVVVSCDSFKLAKCSAASKIEKFGEDEEYKFIIPNKTVLELSRLLSTDEDSIAEVYMSHKNMVVNLGNMIFFSRLINGDYVDYNRFIIKTHKIKVTVDRLSMISALERAALITEEKIIGSVKSYVKLEINGDTMQILAKSTTGSTFDELPIQHEGEDLAIAFSNKFLIDCLKSCTADRILLSMSTALASINIQPDDDDAEDEFFLLLPVRMKTE